MANHHLWLLKKNQPIFMQHNLSYCPLWRGSPVYVDLPYHIDTFQIDSYFGGILNRKTKEVLIDSIQVSNAEVDRILNENIGDDKYNMKQWGIIEPATARLLSQPAEIYIERMVHHRKVQTQLAKIAQK